VLSTRATRDWRPLIFFAVLMFHIAIVLLAIRAARLPISPSAPMEEPLVLLLLPPKARIATDVPAPQTRVGQPRLAPSKAVEPKLAPNGSNAATGSPQQPPIDLEKEAQLAAQNAIANAARENDYRNLSALSPEQLSWLRQNHLEPVEPGIPWKYRRIEITEGGFPIIHINDHCVAIPLMLMMVFCKIGHIEPKGDLFDHMRDPEKH
jgi:hypothetical protein